jgi:hypothetical protein
VKLFPPPEHEQLGLSLEKQRREGSGNLEWLHGTSQGPMSWDDARRQIELFAEHIVPEFGDRRRGPASRNGRRATAFGHALLSS